MIRRGVTTQHQASGNNHADDLARRAHERQAFIVFVMQEYSSRQMYRRAEVSRDGVGMDDSDDDLESDNEDDDGEI